MKRVLLLSACIVTCSALVAQAVVNPSWITQTVTPGGGLAGSDRYEYTLNTNGYPAGVDMAVLEGTWTSESGAILLSSITASWKTATGTGTGSSMVGIPSNGAAVWARVGSTTGAPAGYFKASSFTGGWYTADDTLKLNADKTLTIVDGLETYDVTLSNLLAVIDVTAGGKPSYNGVAGWTGLSGSGYLGGINTPLTLTPVPEPGTLALLASALIGLGLWIRRRR